MKWSKWLENWGMTSLKIKVPFLEMDWKPQDEDKSAAWELYVELLTRITTQPLAVNHGDELSALESVHAIFGLTRGVMKEHGRHCTEFTKIAIVVLNQIVRPFTAKWHKISLAEGFISDENCKDFREDLVALQSDISIFTQMLAEMAGVEDLTTLEDI